MPEEHLNQMNYQKPSPKAISEYKNEGKSTPG